jgi:hypothetical protein
MATDRYREGKQTYLLGAILPGIGCVAKLEHVAGSHNASEEGRENEEPTEVQIPADARYDKRRDQ